MPRTRGSSPAMAGGKPQLQIEEPMIHGPHRHPDRATLIGASGEQSRHALVIGRFLFCRLALLF